MTNNTDVDKATRQAADWMLELERPDLTDDRLAAWQAWLAADTRNQQAFDRLQQVQECLLAMPRLPWPSDEEISAGSFPFADRRRLALVASIAALGIAVATAVWMSDDSPAISANADVIQTSIGELRRVPLPDGSTLTAGGHSRVEVQFDRAARAVSLDEGEAFFEVAKDATRPFVVHSGTVEIKAVGTAFNVRRLGDRTVVSVSEGSVEATDDRSTSRLSAGQQMQLGAGNAELKPTPTARGAVGAWRDGQRQYRAEPLADVVADLARYSTRRILIEDERVAQVAITGTVLERDIDKWLRSLGSALPVVVQTDADGTVRIASEEQPASE